MCLRLGRENMRKVKILKERLKLFFRTLIVSILLSLCAFAVAIIIILLIEPGVLEDFVYVFVLGSVTVVPPYTVYAFLILYFEAQFKLTYVSKFLLIVSLVSLGLIIIQMTTLITKGLDSHMFILIVLSLFLHLKIKKKKNVPKHP